MATIATDQEIKWLLDRQRQRVYEEQQNRLTEEQNLLKSATYTASLVKQIDLLLSQGRGFNPTDQEIESYRWRTPLVPCKNDWMMRCETEDGKVFKMYSTVTAKTYYFLAK